MSKKKSTFEESDSDDYEDESEEKSEDESEEESIEKSEEESEKEDNMTKSYDDWVCDFRDELIFEFVKHFGDRPTYGSFRSTMENFCTTLSDWEKSNPIPE